MPKHQIYLINILMKAKLHTDGAARGNPGPAGIGAVLSDEKGKILKEVYEYLGEATNNQAEYMALIMGLEAASKLGVKDVEIYADSELLVKQVKGEYRVKHEGLKPLYQKVAGLLQKFDRYIIRHVVRENNKEADRLANKAIDERE